ncbi:hypothetical protein CM240_3268 [Clostridium bornimense]|uniref:DUF1906 domain-containing protein n=1 Tax=Clostridium bornimense TaxID=1216932 RepID=W6SKI9_9CLOT|nr:glycoside hydrolase domain-containing protein [Clostridium bornimense]CDM70385.1 hypothetical protein CM240_3268 [Clostridium bornimense]
MADEMVKKVQQWLNINYMGKVGYNEIEENGITSWETIYGLTRALQIELGIEQTSDNFGPTTRSLFKPLSIDSNPSEDDLSLEANSIRQQIGIIQGALWCKGYNPGGFTGYFGEGTKASIIELQTDAGLTNCDGVVDVTIMRALLSMDAFRLLEYRVDADKKIQEIQQAINRDYSSNKYFNDDLGLIPCDGIYGRNTNKGLIYAIQIEEGIDEPTGFVGPQTRESFPFLQVGSENNFVKLLQYALYCNGYDPTGFTGYFGIHTKLAVTNFQKFVALDVDGYVGKQTWASLVTSTGDPDRKGTCCDTSDTITDEIANDISAKGYTTIGRYLTGKYAMKPSEFKLIIDHGFNVVPIYEVYGYEAEWFTEANGERDALHAVIAAKTIGIPEGTTIYFGVDCDVNEDDISSRVIPYFEAVQATFETLDNCYEIGVYAPRYACSRLYALGYTPTSFVCDMSSGFAANLGYPLPKNWAFDQIAENNYTVGGTKYALDNNIASGLDTGCDHVQDFDLENVSTIIDILGFNVTEYEKTTTVFSSDAIKISVRNALEEQISGNYATININDGEVREISGVTLASALEKLELTLSADANIELKKTLLSFGNCDLKVAAEVDATTGEIKIKIEQVKSKTINKKAINVSKMMIITIDKDKLEDYVEEVVKSAVEDLIELIEKILVLVVLAIAFFLIVAYAPIEAIISIVLTLIVLFK